MTSTEARNLRATLGLSSEVLAADFGFTPAIVEAWETGATPVPRFEAETLRFRVAMQEREAVLATSGLAQCPWVLAWEAEPRVERLPKRSDHDEHGYHQAEARDDGVDADRNLTRCCAAGTD